MHVWLMKMLILPMLRLGLGGTYINRSQESRCGSHLRVINILQKFVNEDLQYLAIYIMSVNTFLKNATILIIKLKKLTKTFNLGDWVLLNIPKIDRGPGYSRNMICWWARYYKGMVWCWKSHCSFNKEKNPLE